MSVFTFHDTSDASIQELIGRIFSPNPAPNPDELSIEPFAGPPLLGLSTTWSKWKLVKEGTSFMLPSCLDEGDEDDQPYPCNSGLIAQPDGTTLTYVAANSANEPVTHDNLTEAVVDAAQWESMANVTDFEKLETDSDRK